VRDPARGEGSSPSSDTLTINKILKKVRDAARRESSNLSSGINIIKDAG